MVVKGKASDSEYKTTFEVQGLLDQIDSKLSISDCETSVMKAAQIICQLGYDLDQQTKMLLMAQTCNNPDLLLLYCHVAPLPVGCLSEVSTGPGPTKVESFRNLSNNLYDESGPEGAKREPEVKAPPPFHHGIAPRIATETVHPVS